MDFIQTEEEVLKFWEKKKIRQKALKKKGKKFYFLDGPPYANGKIHLGHALGKYLRDALLRYKRMRGFWVWSKPGFDTHGLPIEVEMEKELKINSKKEIEEFGVKKFISKCKEFAIENIGKMIKDFKRMGIWLDWENPYRTFDDDYISGVWYSIKKADEKGLLYKGKRVVPWCARCETALAKHELEYKKKVDESLYLKFPTEDGRYLIVWTTTPWTVPYNLAVMVNPSIKYVEMEVNGERWIIGKERASLFEGKIIKELNGKDLEGLKYKLPLKIPEQDKIKAKWKHKIVLADFVEESTGTGLVHCAPGCGPEDNEVGKKYGLPAFNTVSSNGVIEGDMGEFSGLKVFDKRIIELLEPIVVKIEKYEHDYPFCWRCKNPVIFRSTEQWFVKVTKLKEKLLEDLKKTKWNPEWAGNKWFKSWIENLQDWDISRQRYWGIPIPVWECKKCGEKLVVGSVEELKKLSRKRKLEVHKPGIDEIKIKCPKCGNEMRRVPDVLDVWIDSGAAPWASLSYTKDKKLFDELWPVDFILEGKDQIRGWFYSLAALGEITFDRIPYENVYMTGFIYDALGRKMSKSLGNYITPFEVIDKYGSEVLRFYEIGGTNPGIDLNYNENDVKRTFKTLSILWNSFKYLKENAEIEKVKLTNEKSDKVEDKWVISRINSVTREVTEAFERYDIQQVPRILTNFIVEDLSHLYLKLIKDRITVGDKEDKIKAMNTLLKVFDKLLIISAPVLPMLTEKMYQEMKKILGRKEESIHFLKWPEVGERNEDLEIEMETTRKIVEKILAIRNKESIGVRWPIRKVIIVKERGIDEIIKKMANVKEIEYLDNNPQFVEYKIKVNYKNLKKKFDEKTFPVAMRKIIETSPIAIKRKFDKGEDYVININSNDYNISRDDVSVVEKLPEEWSSNENIYANTKIDKELFKEGFAREIIRRIQDMRKKMKLKRTQEVEVTLDSPVDVSNYLELIEKKTNSSIELTKVIVGNKETFNIKGYKVIIGITF